MNKRKLFLLFFPSVRDPLLAWMHFRSSGEYIEAAERRDVHISCLNATINGEKLKDVGKSSRNWAWPLVALSSDWESDNKVKLTLLFLLSIFHMIVQLDFRQIYVVEHKSDIRLALLLDFSIRLSLYNFCWDFCKVFEREEKKDFLKFHIFDQWSVRSCCESTRCCW